MSKALFYPCLSRCRVVCFPGGRQVQGGIGARIGDVHVPRSIHLQRQDLLRRLCGGDWQEARGTAFLTCFRRPLQRNAKYWFKYFILEIHNLRELQLSGSNFFKFRANLILKYGNFL